jgi:hypothetical protein
MAGIANLRIFLTPGASILSGMTVAGSPTTSFEGTMAGLATTTLFDTVSFVGCLVVVLGIKGTLSAKSLGINVASAASVASSDAAKMALTVSLAAKAAAASFSCCCCAVDATTTLSSLTKSVALSSFKAVTTKSLATSCSEDDDDEEADTSSSKSCVSSTRFLSVSFSNKDESSSTMYRRILW